MNPNELLLWLSAHGSGTWNRYRSVIDEAQIAGDEPDVVEDFDAGDSLIDENIPLPYRLRLNLERLAHAEFLRRDFPNGWRIVPPTLVCIGDSERSLSVLCGARTDALLDRIRTAAYPAIQITVTEAPECPDTIHISGNDVTDLNHFAEIVGIRCVSNAQLTLLAAIPPVDDIQSRTPADMPFGRGWQASRFSASSLGWSSVAADDARSSIFGLFRFRVRHQTFYYLRLNNTTYRIPVQVGKFVVLKKRRISVLSYDRRARILSLPVACRPPLLVERALTLCSGFLAGFDGGRLHYANVNEHVALAIFSLLRQ